MKCYMKQVFLVFQKLYDKRQDIAKKDAVRRMQKALRQKAKEYNKE